MGAVRPLTPACVVDGWCSTCSGRRLPRRRRVEAVNKPDVLKAPGEGIVVDRAGDDSNGCPVHGSARTVSTAPSTGATDACASRIRSSMRVQDGSQRRRHAEPARTPAETPSTALISIPVATHVASNVPVGGVNRVIGEGRPRSEPRATSRGNVRTSSSNHGSQCTRVLWKSNVRTCNGSSWDRSEQTISPADCPGQTPVAGSFPGARHPFDTRQTAGTR